MFDSALDRETTRDGATNPRRRFFLASAAAAVAGLAVWQWKKPGLLKVAAAADNGPKEVRIVLFSDAGARLKKVHIARIIKTEAEWRATSFRCLRHHPQRRHRNRLFRKTLEPARPGHLPLRLLRQCALRFHYEVRIRHGMA